MAEKQKLKIVLEEGAVMPERAFPGDAGLDLMAPERIDVWPGRHKEVDVKVRVAIPKGCVGLITSKSGLMRDHGIITSGTIDAGYRGTLHVILINTGNRIVTFERGRKIAQLVILACKTPEIEIVEELDRTARGEGGFGSSGAFGAFGAMKNE